jgi:hypothetical protein
MRSDCPIALIFSAALTNNNQNSYTKNDLNFLSHSCVLLAERKLQATPLFVASVAQNTKTNLFLQLARICDLIVALGPNKALVVFDMIHGR